MTKHFFGERHKEMRRKKTKEDVCVSRLERQELEHQYVHETTQTPVILFVYNIKF